MEGKRSKQGPTQGEFHRPALGIVFHCKCNWESTGGFKKE